MFLINENVVKLRCVYYYLSSHVKDVERCSDRTSLKVVRDFHVMTYTVRNKCGHGITIFQNSLLAYYIN